jgi:hypothetical protein
MQHRIHGAAERGQRVVLLLASLFVVNQVDGAGLTPAPSKQF